MREVCHNDRAEHGPRAQSADPPPAEIIGLAYFARRLVRVLLHAPHDSERVAREQKGRLAKEAR